MGARPSTSGEPRPAQTEALAATETVVVVAWGAVPIKEALRMGSGSSGKESFTLSGDDSEKIASKEVVPEAGPVNPLIA